MLKVIYACWIFLKGLLISGIFSVVDVLKVCHVNYHYQWWGYKTMEYLCTNMKVVSDSPGLCYKMSSISGPLAGNEVFSKNPNCYIHHRTFHGILHALYCIASSLFSNSFLWRQVKQHLQDIKKENVGIPEGGGSSRHRNGRKQKISRSHDVSSNDYPGISANQWTWWHDNWCASILALWLWELHNLFRLLNAKLVKELWFHSQMPWEFVGSGTFILCTQSCH